jgi:hypothetical protein
VTKYLGKPGEQLGDVTSIFEASEKYQNAGVPLIVLAGKDYGMGSSRDWAAKGVYLLGVKAVIAESYERIHRSNLVGMGVLPLEYVAGQSRDSLGLTGHEVFDVAVDDGVKPRQLLTVTAIHPQTGKVTTFTAQCRIDTPVEVDYYRNGGILQTVLRKLLGKPGAATNVATAKPPTTKPPTTKAPAPKATAKPAAKAPVKNVAKKPAKKPVKKPPAAKGKKAAPKKPAPKLQKGPKPAPKSKRKPVRAAAKSRR